MLLLVPFLVGAMFAFLMVKNIDRAKPWATVVGFLGVALWIAYALDSLEMSPETIGVRT